jgi:hypothetical protein
LDAIPQQDLGRALQMTPLGEPLDRNKTGSRFHRLRVVGHAPAIRVLGFSDNATKLLSPNFP